MNRSIRIHRKSTVIGLAAIAVSAALVRSAAANEIMINYYDYGNGSGALATLGTSSTQDGAPGAASTGSWNNLDIYGSGGSTNQTLTLASLSDSTGSVTTAQLVEFSPFGGYTFVTSANSTAGTWTSNDSLMLQGEAGTNSSYNPLTISLSGIPYSSYYVYIYTTCLANGTDHISDQSGTSYYFTGNTQVGGTGTGPFTQLAYNQATSTSSTSPTSDADYAVFYESGASSSFTLGYSTSSSNNGAWVYAIQIVSAPEPASLSLLSFAGAALLKRPRWKR